MMCTDGAPCRYLTILEQSLKHRAILADIIYLGVCKSISKHSPVHLCISFEESAIISGVTRLKKST